MNQNYHTDIENIEKAVIKVCNLIEAEENYKIDWKYYPEKQLWFELVSCILGSRVRFETAKACTHHLKKLGLLNLSNILKNPRKIENKMKKELRKPIYPPLVGKIGNKYRFPNSRSTHIIKTAIEIYTNSGTTIKNILRKHQNSREARDILIKKCYGIGPKQASLFLRNISFCNSLAILDSHVIRYMESLKLKENIPFYNGNKNNYLKQENILSEYAKMKKKSLAALDLAIWVVMSLIQKESIA